VKALSLLTLDAARVTGLTKKSKQKALAVPWQCGNQFSIKESVMAAESMHRRLQEYCDCYMETDLLGELETISRGESVDVTGEPQEVALKFIALAVLYGISERAQEAKLVKKANGKVKFEVDAEKDQRLPPPPADVCDHVFDVIQAITHLDTTTPSGLLALGLRSDSVELAILLECREDKKSLKIRFPLL